MQPHAGDCRDYVDMVLTCEGDYYDPDFPCKLNYFNQKLQQILHADKEKLTIKKVEPWNSVKVTLNIPREAAVRLKTLAEEGSEALRSLGVLAVQVEGDRVISMTFAGRDDETTEVRFGSASRLASDHLASSVVSGSAIQPKAPTVALLNSHCHKPKTNEVSVAALRNNGGMEFSPTFSNGMSVGCHPMIAPKPSMVPCSAMAVRHPVLVPSNSIDSTYDVAVAANVAMAPRNNLTCTARQPAHPRSNAPKVKCSRKRKEPGGVGCKLKPNPDVSGAMVFSDPKAMEKLDAAAAGTMRVSSPCSSRQVGRVPAGGTDGGPVALVAGMPLAGNQNGCVPLANRSLLEPGREHVSANESIKAINDIITSLSAAPSHHVLAHQPLHKHNLNKVGNAAHAIGQSSSLSHSAPASSIVASSSRSHVNILARDGTVGPLVEGGAQNGHVSSSTGAADETTFVDRIPEQAIHSQRDYSGVNNNHSLGRHQTHALDRQYSPAAVQPESKAVINNISSHVAHQPTSRSSTNTDKSEGMSTFRNLDCSEKSTWPSTGCVSLPVVSSHATNLSAGSVNNSVATGRSHLTGNGGTLLGSTEQGRPVCVGDKHGLTSQGSQVDHPCNTRVPIVRTNQSLLIKKALPSSNRPPKHKFMTQQATVLVADASPTIHCSVKCNGNSHSRLQPTVEVKATSLPQEDMCRNGAGASTVPFTTGVSTPTEGLAATGATNVLKQSSIALSGAPEEEYVSISIDSQLTNIEHAADGHHKQTSSCAAISKNNMLGNDVPDPALLCCRANTLPDAERPLSNCDSHITAIGLSVPVALPILPEAALSEEGNAIGEKPLPCSSSVNDVISKEQQHGASLHLKRTSGPPVVSFEQNQYSDSVIYATQHSVPVLSGLTTSEGYTPALVHATSPTDKLSPASELQLCSAAQAPDLAISPAHEHWQNCSYRLKSPQSFGRCSRMLSSDEGSGRHEASPGTTAVCMAVDACGDKPIADSADQETPLDLSSPTRSSARSARFEHIEKEHIKLNGMISPCSDVPLSASPDQPVVSVNPCEGSTVCNSRTVNGAAVSPEREFQDIPSACLSLPESSLDARRASSESAESGISLDECSVELMAPQEADINTVLASDGCQHELGSSTMGDGRPDGIEQSAVRLAAQQLSAALDRPLQRPTPGRGRPKGTKRSYLLTIESNSAGVVLGNSVMQNEQLGFSECDDNEPSVAKGRKSRKAQDCTKNGMRITPVSASRFEPAKRATRSHGASDLQALPTVYRERRRPLKDKK